MYREHSIGVVVPAYNEAAFVGEVLETVPAYVDRIYAVDDCSADGTWDEIDRCTDGEADDATTVATNNGARTAFDRRLVPIRHEENRGVGAAIKTGYLRARSDGIEIVAVLAGDGQMDPDHLSALLDPIVDDEADYAKGNRLTTGGHRAEMPRIRLVGNAILTVLTRVASGYWRTTDPQNGYTAISARALEAVDLASIYDGYGYPNDLLARCNAAELRVADVAIPARYGREESTIDYTTYVPRISVLLVRAFVRRLKARYPLDTGHPIPMLYVAGASAAAVGILDAVRTLRKAERPRAGLRSSGLLLVAAVCVALAARLEERANAVLEVRYD
jgi:glycosyltransferase involved in cell wall biosynthesis